MNLNEMMTEVEGGDLMTKGEAAILLKLELIGEALDELTEKVNNLNLSADDGLTLDAF